MRTAVVTGASSGIGREMATMLAQQGYEVVCVARSGEILDEMAASLPNVRPLAADLATSAGVEQLLATVPETDILVNNAGIGDCGPFAESDQGRARQMVELNCVALTALTGGYLPGMLERGAGRVLNVASTAAFQPGPEMAVYYATKAYVLSFSEAIAEELRRTPVTVTAFCPGAFESGFHAGAGTEGTRLVRGRSLPSSEEMARAALAAMERGEVVSVPGAMNKLGAQLPRFTPRPILRRAVHFIQR